jgi:hypothetical protein
MQDYHATQTDDPQDPSRSEDQFTKTVEEEEEGKMFPKVRKLMDQVALEQLGQELEKAKGKKSKAA